MNIEEDGNKIWQSSDSVTSIANKRYSSSKIYENAKGDLERLHFEARKCLLPKPPAQFTVESVFKEEINSRYTDMHEEVNKLDMILQGKVRKDKSEYYRVFKEKIGEMHQEYRELDQQKKDLSSKTKLRQEIDAKIFERDTLRMKCEASDKK